jgi:protein-disulfide isomerase
MESGSNLRLMIVVVIILAVVSTAAITALVAGGSSGGRVGSMNQAEVEKIVENYLKNYPERVIAALEAGQQKQEQVRLEEAKKNISAKREELENDAKTPIAGNAKGDVTIVTFFDYNCGYCKRVVPTLEKLLADDKNLKIAFKDFPILGEGSVVAGKVSVAFAQVAPEKYFDFHVQMMKKSPRSEEQMLEIVKGLGVDPAKVKEMAASKEVADLIEKKRALGQEIGVRGTPAFIVGGELVPGAIDEAQFKAMIEKARKSKS